MFQDSSYKRGQALNIDRKGGVEHSPLRALDQIFVLDEELLNESNASVH